jgi:hypothetical protein
MRHALIVPDRSRTRLLLTLGPHGWGLPAVTRGRPHPGETDGILRAVRRRYGIDAVVLRCAARSRGTRTTMPGVVLELELLAEPGARSPRTRWVTLADLRRLLGATIARRSDGGSRRGRGAATPPPVRSGRGPAGASARWAGRSDASALP